MKNRKVLIEIGSLNVLHLCNRDVKEKPKTKEIVRFKATDNLVCKTPNGTGVSKKKDLEGFSFVLLLPHLDKPGTQGTPT